MTPKLIIGIGGAGANISQFLTENLHGTSELLLINTDKGSLDKSSTANCVLLVLSLSSATKKSDKLIDTIGCVENEILKYAHDKSDVVITVGLGGCTGTYAFSSIANLLKKHSKKVTLVAVFPFSFEGERRRLAEEEFAAFKDSTNINVITFDNDSMARNLSVTDGFRKANEAILASLMG
jgi:cell division protein FtsZ